MRIFKNPLYFIRKLIKRVFLFFALFLFLRLILRFLGANPITPVVHTIYQYSDFIASPFLYIFPDAVWKGHIIEMSTLSAIIGYGILAFVFLRLIDLLLKD